MSASFNSTVTVTIEVAFGEDPLDATISWTEISSSVRQFSIDRGRSHILDEMQAGRAVLVLNNSTGNFNPANTAGAYYPGVGVNVPIRIRATYNAVTYDLFRGMVTSWPQQAGPGGKDPHVTIECVDAFNLFAMRETEITLDPSGTPAGLGIDGHLTSYIGWPGSWRDLDDGNHYVTWDTQFDTSLNHMMRMVLVEQGLFYIAGNGDAIFRDGNTRIQDKASVAFTFDDDGTDIPYTNLEVSWDDTQLWNRVTVTRAGGEPQDSEDATSVGDHGMHELVLSDTFHVADGEALALADWLVAQNGTIIPRVPEITFTPAAAPTTAWPAALGADFWDRIRVRRQLTGDDLDLEFHLEGINHDVSMVGLRQWTTTFRLSPALRYDDWWILGTSQLGTDTRLGY